MTYQKKGWKVGNSCENGSLQCSLIKAPDIYIEFIPRQKIEILMEEYPHQEWLGYLIGKENKDSGDIFVEEIFIPPHAEASGASAEAEPFHKPSRCVGIIHSHHSMGAFHSATDKEYVDKNFPVSITVANRSNNLEYDAISYLTTPCGKSTTGKCTVKYVQPPPMFNRKSFVKMAKKNIDKPKVVVTTAVGFPEYSYYGYNSYSPPYVPYRYRMPQVVVDEAGNVLSGKDYVRLMDEAFGKEDEKDEKANGNLAGWGKTTEAGD